MKSGMLTRPEGRQQVTIVYPDGSLHPQPGTIVFTDSAEDPLTATVRSKVELANPDAALMPGQFVRVRPQGLQLKKVVLIPRQAVFTTQQGSSVYVVDREMKAQLRQVTENMAIGKQVLIAAGLQAGERIITAGMMKVQPGARVRQAAAAGAQPPAAASR
jgi:membrane fusion protein (multidrug efflux system)